MAWGGTPCGKSGVDMSTPLLPEGVREIDADPLSLDGRCFFSHFIGLKMCRLFCSVSPLVCICVTCGGCFLTLFGVLIVCDNAAKCMVSTVRIPR